MTKNNFDQLDKEYANKITAIQTDFKQNKDKVVEYLIDNIMNVELELPENIKKGSKNRKDEK